MTAEASGLDQGLNLESGQGRGTMALDTDSPQSDHEGAGEKAVMTAFEIRTALTTLYHRDNGAVVPEKVVGYVLRNKDNSEALAPLAEVLLNVGETRAHAIASMRLVEGIALAPEAVSRMDTGALEISGNEVATAFRHVANDIADATATLQAHNNGSK